MAKKLGKKYDLEFKSAKKSGRNFKTAEDMIEMYSQLCSGRMQSSVVRIDVWGSLPVWPHIKLVAGIYKLNRFGFLFSLTKFFFCEGAKYDDYRVILERGTTSWILQDSIMVELSFQSIGFSVSLVDLVMFGASQSMVTGSTISQDMAFPKSGQGRSDTVACGLDLTRRRRKEWNGSREGQEGGAGVKV